ncbi:hypothetical protein [Propionicimonas sp.]
MASPVRTTHSQTTTAFITVSVHVPFVPGHGSMIGAEPVHRL